MSSVTGAELEAAEFWRDCTPGRSVGLWFSVSDHVWHEFLLLYPGVGTCYVGYTPDGDMYADSILCDDATSCQKAFLCDNMGGAPPQAKGAYYRFRHYPDQEEFVKLIRKPA